MNYMPKNIKAVLFDMDGTLWDTEQVSERAIGQLLEEWRIDSYRSGIWTSYLDQYKEFITWLDQYSRMLDASPENWGQQESERCRATFRSAPRHLPEPLP